MCRQVLERARDSAAFIGGELACLPPGVVRRFWRRGRFEAGLKLNRRMGTVSKQDMSRKTSRRGGWTVTEICIVVVLIVLLAAMAIPNFVRSRSTMSANSCINNLRILDSAKAQWALLQKKKNTDIPAGSDIQPYMGGGPAGELPVCPIDPKQTFDSSYSLNSIGAKPTCKIMPADPGHILP